MAAFIGRRQFITLLGGAAAAWPLAAGAQQAERVRRIGVLMGIANDSEGQARMAVFRKTMESLGWIEGRNLQLDYRWAPIAAPQARVFAEELVQQKPDLIFCLSTSVTMAVRNAAATIPVVFVQVTDPMSAGLVQNWAKPGGNLTGFTNFEPSMSGKWLELLRTLARISHTTGDWAPGKPILSDAGPAPRVFVAPKALYVGNFLDLRGSVSCARNDRAGPARVMPGRRGRWQRLRAGLRRVPNLARPGRPMPWRS